jgi:hypothetical protein
VSIAIYRTTNRRELLSEMGYRERVDLHGNSGNPGRQAGSAQNHIKGAGHDIVVRRSKVKEIGLHPPGPALAEVPASPASRKVRHQTFNNSVPAI